MRMDDYGGISYKRTWQQQLHDDTTLFRCPVLDFWAPAACDPTALVGSAVRFDEIEEWRFCCPWIQDFFFCCCCWSPPFSSSLINACPISMYGSAIEKHSQMYWPSGLWDCFMHLQLNPFSVLGRCSSRSRPLELHSGSTRRWCSFCSEQLEFICGSAVGRHCFSFPQSHKLMLIVRRSMVIGLTADSGFAALPHNPGDFGFAVFPQLGSAGTGFDRSNSQMLPLPPHTCFEFAMSCAVFSVDGAFFEPRRNSQMLSLPPHSCLEFDMSLAFLAATCVDFRAEHSVDGSLSDLFGCSSCQDLSTSQSVILPPQVCLKFSVSADFLHSVAAVAGVDRCNGPALRLDRKDPHVCLTFDWATDSLLQLLHMLVLYCVILSSFSMSVVVECRC